MIPHSRASVGAVVVFCTLQPATVTAAALAVGSELRLGGGYDSTLFRLAPSLPESAKEEDVFVEARPRLDLQIATQHNDIFSVTVEGVFRDFDHAPHGQLIGAYGSAAYVGDWGKRFGLRTKTWASFEAPNEIREGRYQTFGGEFGGIWHLTETVDVSLGIEGRWFRSPSQSLQELNSYGPSASTTWSGNAWLFGATVGWLTNGNGWEQWVGQVFGFYTTGTWGITNVLGVGIMDAGHWLQGTISIERALNEAWSFGLEYWGSRESYGNSQPPWGHYGGLLVRYSWDNRQDEWRDLVESQLEQQEEVSLHSPKRKRVWVVVNVQAEHANKVAIRGDFNRWKRPLRLKRRGAVWQLRLRLRPGRYEFQVEVDGAMVVPGGAASYVPDGFGGTNAVLVVANGPHQADLHCSE